MTKRGVGYHSQGAGAAVQPPRAPANGGTHIEPGARSGASDVQCPSRYRKRPVEIEAAQWLPNDTQASRRVMDWLHDEGAAWYVGEDSSQLVIETLEGPMVTVPNAWVVRGVAGEFYSVKPDIFEQTYEAVDV